MVEPLRHRQTKEAETDMFDLQPPRHISTLHEAAVCCGATSGRVLEILWTRRDFRVKQRAQHGQRGIVRTIADFPQITVFQAIGTSR